MTDEIKPEKYEPGDVVWVKLGPFWWPGEVAAQSEATEDLTKNLRKEPVAIVKFEDDYMECVLSHDQIYPYNCEKKSFFIKKGMNAYRAKNAKMESFPKDVTAAEVKTGGNPNIISEEENERKRNYNDDIFGTPQSAKRSKHSGSGRKKGRPSGVSSKKSTPVVTHRRFLGYDDFEVKILIQGDGCENTETDDAALKCPSCTFTTDRMAMLMMHSKTHIKSKQILASIKKPVKRRKKTSLLSDDEFTSDGEKKPKTKRKYTKKAKIQKTDGENSDINQSKTDESPKKSAETVADIIANWDDDDVDDAEETSELNESSMIETKRDDNDEDFEEDEPGKREKKDEKEDSSCFDFDENDESTLPSDVSSAGEGRKIPRVISEKTKSHDESEAEKTEIENKTTEQSLKIGEEDEEEKRKDEILREARELATSATTSSSRKHESEIDENLENTYKSLMEETKTDIPIEPDELLSKEQNFHGAKTVKYPDKNEKDSTNTTSKSNKRKSFPTSRRSLRSNRVEMVEKEEKPVASPKVEELSTISDDLKKIQEVAAENVEVSRRSRKSRKLEEPPLQNGKSKEKVEEKPEKVEKIEDKVEKIEDNVEKIENKVEKNENKVEKIENKVEIIEDKVEKIEDKVENEIEMSSPLVAPEEIAATPTPDVVKSKKGRPKKLEIAKEPPEVEAPSPAEEPKKRRSSRKSQSETPIIDAITTPEEPPVQVEAVKSDKIPPKRVEESEEIISEEENNTTKAAAVQPVQKENLRRSSRRKIETENVSSPLPPPPPVETEEIKQVENTSNDSVKTDAEKPKNKRGRWRKNEVPSTTNVEEVEKLKIESENDKKETETAEKIVKEINTIEQENDETPKIVEEVKKVRKPSRWDKLAVEEKEVEIPKDAGIEKKKSRWDQKANSKPKTESNSIFDTPEKSTSSSSASVAEESTSSSSSKQPEVNDEKVATKLTNPKKRFVKSFEDFELNRAATAPETPPEVGKTPIAFKLKKQFISKISNIFEEDNEEVEKKKLTIPTAMSTEKVEKVEVVEPPKTPPTTEKDEPKIEIITKNFPFESEKEEETEFVTIDGNLKVVSEKELAEGQIELTTTPKKSKTILNFSMDFSEEEDEKIVPKPTPPKVAEKPVNSIEIVEKSDVDALSNAIEMEKTVQSTIEESLGPKSTKTSGKLEENHNITIEELLQSPKTEEAEKNIVETAPQSPLVLYNTAKSTNVTEMCDLEDVIPSQIVCTKNKIGSCDSPTPTQPTPNKSKLMSRLTSGGDKSKTDDMSGLKSLKIDPNATKSLIKAAIKSKTPQSSSSGNNAIILSEKIIRPARPDQKIVRGSVDAKNAANAAGKAKILNQTIIKPAGDLAANTSVDEFDINSMPIVISDELLTAESLENMPIVLGTTETQAATTTTASVTQKIRVTPSGNYSLKVKSSQNNVTKILNKSITFSATNSPSSAVSQLLKKNPNLRASTNKIMKHATTPTAIGGVQARTPPIPSGSSKYMLVEDSGTPNKTISRKPIYRKTLPVTKSISGATNAAPASGHKIMIVTNQHGEQQRLLLTPATQKLFGVGNVKSAGGAANIIKKSIATTLPQSQVVASTSKTNNATQIVQKLMKTAPSSAVKLGNTSTPILKKFQKSAISKAPQQKTILIKNHQGQIVKKIQGTDDALLDKQVAEQLEAIKASNLKAQSQKIAQSAALNRKSYAKKIESTVPKLNKPEPNIPPPLTPLKQEVKPEKVPKDRPLNQLVIQDNMGNQTTVTEGQILALPSETVDGQPQSYMLVTLDESGNLTPLNNEALMSLDPNLAANLAAGGDLSNMVLQLDSQSVKESGVAATTTTTVAQSSKNAEATSTVVSAANETSKLVEPEVAATESSTATAAAQVQVTCNLTGGESGQQIILTGDPMATQKFLDSLSEGSTDLASILAGAEGNSFLIQADGEQILINTTNNSSTDSQLLQQTPALSKNQDILAAALADTDVFQQDSGGNTAKASSTTSVAQLSQLSPTQSTGLFPINVGNVLETSLTLNSPIMTPLEVPSNSSKKISDADMLTTQNVKNVDLPITVTDPNISQTVSTSQQQQAQVAAGLMSSSELPELSLAVSEGVTTSVQMNSPSQFVYALEEHATKSYDSMPLLEIDENSTNSKETSILERMEMKKTVIKTSNSTEMMTADGSFIEEGLCTLGGAMCSSLSEPPPEMFDLPPQQDMLITSNENSMEIPIQPPIVADLKGEEQVVQQGGEME